MGERPTDTYTPTYIDLHEIPEYVRNVVCSFSVPTARMYLSLECNTSQPRQRAGRWLVLCTFTHVFSVSWPQCVPKYGKPNWKGGKTRSCCVLVVETR